MHQADVAIIGGGILGLAHAITAVLRGDTVVLFERNTRARGASVRNFGMVWPIGMPKGSLLNRANRSRELWMEFSRKAGFWLEEAGSIHIAHREDEFEVLREFHDLEAAERGGFELLGSQSVAQSYPHLARSELVGGLLSSNELRVDPREAIASLTGWLAAHERADVRLGTPVRRVEPSLVESSDGKRWRVRHTIICSGDDFETLYPETFAASGLTRCKLQMMRTGPQPDDWRLGPTLAGGLTICHYESFANCPTLPALRRRLEEEFPEHFRWGIHVLAAQNELGEVIIGDSHEYGMEFEPTERTEIEQLIMQYLDRIVALPNSQIAQRWHGTYARRTTGDGALIANPEEGVTVVACGNGAGMTMSFGLAEDVWDEVGGNNRV